MVRTDAPLLLAHQRYVTLSSLQVLSALLCVVEQPAATSLNSTIINLHADLAGAPGKEVAGDRQSRGD